MRTPSFRLAGLLLAAACLLCACADQDPGSSHMSSKEDHASSLFSTVGSGSDSSGSGTSLSPDSHPDPASDPSEPPSVPDPSSDSASSGASSSDPPPSAGSKPATTTPTTSVPVHTGPIDIRTPEASGTVVYAENGATIDASHIADGYVMVKYSGSASKVKVQMVTPGRTYNYDLNTSGRYEVFPLQAGDGTYKVRIMRNISGSNYSELYSVTFRVALSSVYAPFLYPNQYVSYTAASAAVQKSFDLCAGASGDLAKIEAVYRYVTEHVKYDTAKANSVTSGYLPDVDETLRTNKGICFDYAALVTAMLRAQNIPTKLVIGTVSPGNLSHAWNLVYTKEKGWLSIRIYFEGGTWKLMDATFGASMGQGIDDYIGNGSNYTELRLY